MVVKKGRVAMKKFICVLCFILALINLCSCGNLPSSSGRSTYPSSPTPSQRELFDGEKAVSQLDIQTYWVESNWNKYAIVTIKNNSEYNLRISVDVNFYDEDGNLIGVDHETQEAVESGYETAFSFIVDDEATDVDGEYSIIEETWYDCVLSDLSYESSEAKDKIILSVTNNGDKPADFVQANVIFFDGSSPVGFDWTYVVDDDSEIKPGRTVKKELRCYESFDSYLVFFSGRR